MRYRLIERLDAAAGARLHDAALHRGEYERGEPVQVATFGKAVASVFQAAPDGAGPRLKIRRDSAVRRKIFGLDLQGQPSQRTTVLAARLDQPFAITGQNGEDAIDRVAFRRDRRLDDDGLQGVQVTIQNGEQQSFLPREEMVKAARVGLRAMQDLGHAGGGVSALPEEIAGRVQQSIAS